MNTVFEATTGLLERENHYCPGCAHGIIHRLFAEAMVQSDVLSRAIGVAPVGCAGLCYNYFACDMLSSAHGRAPAVATGIKRGHRDNFVFTYQGDGDLASIGTAEIVHAAARGENISVIFVNNATYGMTGGQMAPTTLLGQRTTTTPTGRDALVQGYPLGMSEMLATLEGAVFVERVAVNTPANIRRAKAAMLKCIKAQTEKAGFGIVEVLSTCPTNWGMSAVKSMEWLGEHMVARYPLLNFKDWTKSE